MCPRLGGSAFSIKAERDFGVSSKAHKFACELRALLASDKHLGSAERSERQVLKAKHASECPRHGGGLLVTGYAIAADPTRDLSSIEECGGELRSFGASWKACLRGV